MMAHRLAFRKSRSGFVLLMSLGAVVFFSLAIVAVLVRGVWQSQASTRLYNRSSALQLADAAVDQAARNLTTSDSSDDITSATLAAGSFQIDSAVEVSTTIYRVTAHGTSGSEQRRVEAIFRLTPQSVFQFALFGSQNVNVSGNAVTDSYDSASGSYDEDTAGHHGDVGTNSTSVGGVTVGGNIFVDGQVMVGPNVADPESVVTGYDPAFITGGTSPPSDTQDVASASQTFPMPAVTVPAGLTCNDHTVAGNTTETLSPGTYCYHNLTIQGNADLTASGEVTIYVTGELTAQGNSVVGVPDDPTQMLFLMTATADATLEQTIQGNNTFHGAIYGPQATFTIQGNATIYGSVIAQQVDVTGNATIHYDEALEVLTQISNSYATTRIAWREL